MRVIDLALKDLRQITRDRKTFIFLLVMPIAFTLLFGFAFGGNSTADPRLPIGIQDNDNSDLSQRLLMMLENSEVVRPEMADTAVTNLPQQVSDENIAAAVIIPAGFGDGLRAGEPPLVTVIATGQTGFTVEGEVQTAVFRMLSAIIIAQTSLETAVQHNLLPDAAAQQAHFDDILDSALTAWETPSITITAAASSALSDEATAEDSNYSVFAQTSPGMMAQFAIAGLMGAATILVIEKKTRSVQRLLTTNLSRGQILLGHYLAMFVMIFLQLSVLILFGQIFLDLPYLSQPIATLLVTVAAAMFSASLGLLIGTLAKTEEQVIIFALVPMFVLAALGGAWMPLEFTPETFQRVAYLTPLAWMIEGYKDILVRGQGVAEVMSAVFVLLAYAVVIFLIAIWRFRFD
ncbi:MAG: ABC transporter permease [Chloroflexi bacterium]|nr:ABC transporter permease [Chloroflexota bacterium]